jgi:hypothetical protein
MTFGALLQDRKDAIVRTWFAEAVAIYGGEGAKAFSRQKDPFANPVGHSLREGTREIFEAILAGAEVEELDTHLRGIVKIRAVQEFSPSQAVGFVFGLKSAVRAELGTAISDTRHAPDLAAFDDRVDQVALKAFDIFTECREQLCDLRVNEVKRRVSWVIEKLNERGVGCDSVEES